MLEARYSAYRGIIATWLMFLAVVAAATAGCIRWLDYPVEKLFFTSSHHGWIGYFLGGRALVAYETLIITALAITRILVGRLPTFGKLTLLAGAASIITYAVNEFVLKPFFGRLPPNEIDFTHFVQVFHYFQGSDASSFPSGHMALAASFLGVFYRLSPTLKVPITITLLLGCLVLVSGGWHFVSDVIAGTFFGFSAGILVGELWIKHGPSAT